MRDTGQELQIQDCPGRSGTLGTYEIIKGGEWTGNGRIGMNMVCILTLYSWVFERGRQFILPHPRTYSHTDMILLKFFTKN